MLAMLGQPVSCFSKALFNPGPRHLAALRAPVQVLLTLVLSFPLSPTFAAAGGCLGPRTEHDSGKRWPCNVPSGL